MRWLTKKGISAPQNQPERLPGEKCKKSRQVAGYWSLPLTVVHVIKEGGGSRTNSAREKERNGCGTTKLRLEKE